ncbi:hypothetical protein PLESTM_000846500 [Pleodorina starrii]|nr:hypothetical protein PLESTM_000846500 [Pleodorina starrii]
MTLPIPRAPRRPGDIRKKQKYDDGSKIRDALKRIVKRLKNLGLKFSDRDYGYQQGGKSKAPYGAMLIATRPTHDGVTYSVSGWMDCPGARGLVQDFSEELHALLMLMYPKRKYKGARKEERAKDKQLYKSRFLRSFGRKAADVLHQLLASAAANGFAAAAEDAAQLGDGVQPADLDGPTAPVAPRAATAAAGPQDQPPLLSLPYCNNGQYDPSWKSWSQGADGTCLCGGTCAEGRKFFPSFPKALPLVPLMGKKYAGTNVMYEATIAVACSHSPDFKVEFESAEKKWKERRAEKAGQRLPGRLMGEQLVAATGGNTDTGGDDEVEEPSGRATTKAAGPRRREGTAWDPNTKAYDKQKLVAAFEQFNGGAVARGISQMVKQLGGSARDLVSALAHEGLAFHTPTPSQLADMTRMYHELRGQGKPNRFLGSFIAESVPGGWTGARVEKILKQQEVWMKGGGWSHVVVLPVVEHRRAEPVKTRMPSVEAEVVHLLHQASLPPQNVVTVTTPPGVQ